MAATPCDSRFLVLGGIKFDILHVNAQGQLHGTRRSSFRYQYIYES